MATKLYLPSTGAAVILPAWSVSWDGGTASGGASKLKAVTTPISSSMATVSHVDTDVTDLHFYFGMWVSDRLAPQVIAAQAISCSIKCSEATAKGNMSLHWIVRCVAANGTTFQTLFAFNNDGNEVPLTAAIASRYDSVTSTATTVNGGDRIVIELGLGGNPLGTVDYHNSSMIIGDNGDADLLGSDGDTELHNPWVNFANTLTFMRDRNFITHQ